METKTIRIRVVKNGDQYLGECLDYPVMTHGRTFEELTENMERAITLFLSGREPGEDEGEEHSVNVEIPKVEDEADAS